MNTKLKTLLVASSLAITPLLAPAQLATWTGTAADGLWNTPGNWDLGVPAEGTNVFIPAGSVVNYTAPMVAGSFLSLSNLGSLNIDSAGFVIGGSGSTAGFVSGSASARLNINAGGIVSVTNGGLTMNTNGSTTVAVGGELTVSGTLVVGVGGNSSTGGGQGYFTNSGGLINVGSIIVNNSGNNQACRAVIQGGTNNLGDARVRRSNVGNFNNPPGIEGLLIYGGQVNTTSIDVGYNGANSWLSMLLAGGTLTNAGDFIVQQVTASRASRFIQTAGINVSAGSVNLRGHTANNSIAIYSVTGGTNLFSGLVLGNPAGTDVAGRLLFTNAAKVYIGGGGMSSVGSHNGKTIALNAGGIFGAQADWTGTESILLGGGSFDCADLGGTAHNIGISGVLTGTSPLIKSGAGTLTLDGVNTYSGATIISQGTLAIGPGGSIASSSPIYIGTGTTLDVSAVGGGFIHATGRTLSGFGSVVGGVAAASGSIINPGSNVLAGTLTFANGLTQQGGVINHFDLSSNPAGADNDRVVITGDLNVDGATNSIEILGSPSEGGIYALIQYSGSLIGSIDNFALSGALGALSNSIALKTIYLTVTAAGRAPTNMVWIGNATENVWDTLQHTNWLHPVTLAPASFIPGDTAKFNALGAANPIVDIPVPVTPGSIIVDAATDYTFTGLGGISGLGSLTKTNTGTLIVQTTNNYTGPTILAGGKFRIGQIDPAGSPSMLGASDASAANLVFNGGTLEYTGSSATLDRAATLAGGGGGIGVTDGLASVQTTAPITGPGKLIKTGAGQWDVRSPNDFSGGTEILEGAVRLDRTAQATLGTNTVTLNGTEAAAAILQFGGDTQRLNNTLNVIGTNNFTVNDGNNTILNLSGNGTLIAQAGGTLTLEGNTAGFAGRLIMDTLANLRFHPGTGSRDAIFDLGVGTGLLNNRNGNVTIYLGAVLGGLSTRIEGGSSNDGNGRSTTYVVGGRNLSTTFDGVIQEVTTERKANIVKEGTGTWTLTGSSTYTGFTTVSNGVLALRDNGSIDNTALITVVSPGALSVSDRFDPVLQLGVPTPQTLTGDGTILGSLTVNALGLVNPGLPIGTLTVTNLITLTGTNVMDLNRDGTIKNDRLAGQSVVQGGTLIVNNLGSSLQVGDTFDLFDGNIFGGFTTVILPSYYTWNTGNLAIDGTISVSAVLPPPTFGSIALTGSDIVLNATNGIPFSTFVVLGSTNVALPVSQWTPVVTNQFDADGSLTWSIPLNSAVPAQFFLLQGN